MSKISSISRRSFLKTGVRTGAAGSLIATGGVAGFPAISYAASRPAFTHGIQSGDISNSSGMIWARSDRAASLSVKYSTTESMANAITLPPSFALSNHDYALKRLLPNLPSGQDIFYQLQLRDLNTNKASSDVISGRFKTAPRDNRNVRFAWSGDTAGQGWGIDTERGGMKTYRTMLNHSPDFFIHSGDTIYADGPISLAKEMPDGGIWNNLVTEGVEKVAESLDEFRGRWKYNLLDDNVREFNQSVPTFFQWDDHEVVNNWSSAKDLSGDDRYTEKSVELLAARAGRAFNEMTPIRYTPEEPGRVYRKLSYGPLLDVFFLDLRSYRGANTAGMESELDESSVVLGRTQLDWLKSELTRSRATWKVIANDMPLGLVVWDNWKEQSGVEAVANGDNGKPLGRELEFAELLRYVKNVNINNLVFLTADVHYTAAHRYSPENAANKQFNPFWEFVSGPLHAGTFGPNTLDMTFGPEVMYTKAPTPDQGVNLPPSMGMQFFGLVDIEGSSKQLTVKLMDQADTELYSVALDPVFG